MACRQCARGMRGMLQLNRRGDHRQRRSCCTHRCAWPVRLQHTAAPCAAYPGQGPHLQEGHQHSDVVPAAACHGLAGQALGSHVWVLHRVRHQAYCLLVCHHLPQPVTGHDEHCRGEGTGAVSEACRGQC